MRLFIALPHIFAIVTILDAMGSSLGMNALTLPYPIQYESTVATLSAHCFFLEPCAKVLKSLHGQKPMMPAVFTNDQGWLLLLLDDEGYSAYSAFTK